MIGHIICFIVLTCDFSRTKVEHVLRINES
ncbi:unnamed protein product [Nippostrongylus brasiliensis]|uniref:Uncharacterized protein n=1 Tax=Nippostrongylus brasiliensis TaxID=27835 RepID=A0A0N4YYC6_NIPBR|nr:unnamed protein product [Nippostrongylus brasiliensis]